MPDAEILSPDSTCNSALRIARHAAVKLQKLPRLGRSRRWPNLTEIIEIDRLLWQCQPASASQRHGSGAASREFILYACIVYSTISSCFMNCKQISSKYILMCIFAILQFAICNSTICNYAVCRLQDRLDNHLPSWTQNRTRPRWFRIERCALKERYAQWGSS